MKENEEKITKKLIPFPNIEKVINDIKELKREVEKLIFQRDELVLVIGKNIEMAYMLALGDLEYQIYQLQCDILRTRRKIELIQARINRQEAIEMADIEKNSILNSLLIKKNLRLNLKK